MRWLRRRLLEFEALLKPWQDDSDQALHELLRSMEQLPEKHGGSDEVKQVFAAASDMINAYAHDIDMFGGMGEETRAQTQRLLDDVYATAQQLTEREDCQANKDAHARWRQWPDHCRGRSTGRDRRALCGRRARDQH